MPFYCSLYVENKLENWWIVRRAPGKITAFLHIVPLLIKPTNNRDSNNPFNEPSNNEDLENLVSIGHFEEPSRHHNNWSELQILAFTSILASQSSSLSSKSMSLASYASQIQISYSWLQISLKLTGRTLNLISWSHLELIP